MLCIGLSGEWDDEAERTQDKKCGHTDGDTATSGARAMDHWRTLKAVLILNKGRGHHVTLIHSKMF